MSLSLRFLALASFLMFLAFWIPLPFGEGLFAVLAALFPVALMAVGAERHGRLPKLLKATFLVLSVLLVLCMLGLLAGRGQVETWPWFGSLPLATAIELYGIFLGPLLLVVYAYAATFDRFTLAQEDLESLRQEFGTKDGEN